MAFSTSVGHSSCHCLNLTAQPPAMSSLPCMVARDMKYSCHHQDRSPSIALPILEQAGMAWYVSAAVALGPVRRLGIPTAHGMS